MRVSGSDTGGGGIDWVVETEEREKRGREINEIREGVRKWRGNLVELGLKNLFVKSLEIKKINKNKI